MERSGVSIGALAEAAGVNVETVRFYQRRGLMREPARGNVSCPLISSLQRA